MKSRQYLFFVLFALGILTWVTNVASSEQAPEPCDASVAPNEYCILTADQIHPTQFAVGQVAATCKALKINKWMNKHREEGGSDISILNQYLSAKEEDGTYKRAVPAVLAPDGKYYITDHHHLSYATVIVKKNMNLDNTQIQFVAQIREVGGAEKYTTMEAFWPAMRENNKFWPYDEAGLLLPGWDSKDEKDWRLPDNFPASVSDLRNDSFRTLSRWVRESCAYLKEGKEQCASKKFGNNARIASFYMEYAWANYLRAQFGDNHQQYGGKELKANFLADAQRYALTITPLSAKYFWDDEFENTGYNSSGKVCKMEVKQGKIPEDWTVEGTPYCAKIVMKMKPSGKESKTKCEKETIEFDSD